MSVDNQFVDEEFEEIENIKNDTNLITKINTPINILLISLIIAVIIMICIVQFAF